MQGIKEDYNFVGPSLFNQSEISDMSTVLMLLLQNPLKSVISDMLSGKNWLSELLIGHWPEIKEHI